MREIKPIAKIRTDFTEKFGIPRQSGLVGELKAKIVFEPEYRQPESLIGIEDYSYLWLVWDFSLARELKKEEWSPTVYPPRLGGKEKRGVFATRSPFRPNFLGLSSVKLEGIEQDEKLGTVLIVSGADILDNTDIYDIKPYIPYADSHPDAMGGFGQEHKDDKIEVVFPKELLEKLPENKQVAAVAVLAQDPRAAYNKKPDYVYGMAFAGFDIRFVVCDDKLIVKDVISKDERDFVKVK